ncbi:hypothetical protein [Streptomyces sp. NPDC002676]
MRELYQNALDACRYRAMRRDYLRSIGAPPAEWAGRITFTQGRERSKRLPARVKVCLSCSALMPTPLSRHST